MAKKIIILVLVFILSGFLYKSFYTNTTPLYWGFGIEGFPIQEQQILDLKQETGIQPQFIEFYFQWDISNESSSSLLSTLDAIWNLGAVPCITWEPIIYKQSSWHTIPFEDIIQGKYDDYLSTSAKAIRTFNEPVIIRFAHEMNLQQYHWGTKETLYGPSSPDIYIQMFRYLVDYFRQENAQNVLWAFCPNVDSIPNEPWNQATHYYPGDNYVDILGMDGYNWENPHRSFYDIFSPLHSELKNLNNHLPIFVFETASANEDTKRKNWIKEALKTSKKWNLQAFIWFHVDKEKNWKLTLNESEIILQNTSDNAQKWAQTRLLHN